MSLKSTLGYHIYRGQLRPLMKELSRLSIKIGMPNKEITFRALHLLLDRGNAKADDLQYYLSKVENHVLDTKIFLLHIPKTAGTSIRETIGEAIGVPAVTYYQNYNDRKVFDWHNLSFWPFFLGIFTSIISLRHIKGSQPSANLEAESWHNFAKYKEISRRF